MAKQTKIGIAIFIVNRNYEYLLSSEKKSGAKKMAWSLPGGNIRYGEKIIDAVHRAVKEETGCRIKHVGLLNHSPFESYMYPDGHFYHILFFKADVFTEDEFEGQQRLIKNGKRYTIRWCRREDFPSNLMKPLPKFLLRAKASQELF